MGEANDVVAPKLAMKIARPDQARFQRVCVFMFPSRQGQGRGTLAQTTKRIEGKRVGLGMSGKPEEQ